MVSASTAEMLNGNLNTAQRMLIEGRALCEAAQNIHAALAATLLLSDAAALQGEFEQARESYQQVLAQAVGDEGMLDDQSYALVGLAGIAYECNELGEAEQHATRALELGVRPVAPLGRSHVADHDLLRVLALD
jgi:tetratricopeptide (TPR) repeat protein